MSTIETSMPAAKRQKKLVGAEAGENSSYDIAVQVNASASSIVVPAQVWTGGSFTLRIAGQEWMARVKTGSLVLSRTEQNTDVITSHTKAMILSHINELVHRQTDVRALENDMVGLNSEGGLRPSIRQELEALQATVDNHIREIQMLKHQRELLSDVECTEVRSDCILPLEAPSAIRPPEKPGTAWCSFSEADVQTTAVATTRTLRAALPDVPCAQHSIFIGPVRGVCHGMAVLADDMYWCQPGRLVRASARCGAANKPVHLNVATVMSMPHDIVVDDAGLIYVADGGILSIQVFSVGRKRQMHRVRSIPTEFLPSALAVDNSTVYAGRDGVVGAISKENNTVLWKRWLPHVTLGGLAVDDTFLYCAQSQFHCIQVLEKKSGRPVRVFGSHGSGPGELDAPHRLTIRGNLLWVCDNRNNRVQALWKTDGSFVHSVSTLTAPHALSFGEEFLYVTSINRATVHKL